MTQTKVFKRDNGDRYKVLVSVYIDSRGVIWSETITHCPKGKRKFTDPIALEFNYEYRQLGMKE